VTERLLNSREVAEILGLSVKTVLARFERGDLPGFRLYGSVGAPVRFRPSEIEAAVAEWEAAAPGRGACQHTASDAAVRSIVPLVSTPGRHRRPTTEEDT
jgi:predicted DNA-binding transcriptional regulator AlpA